jgi:hypothetical protein
VGTQWQARARRQERQRRPPAGGWESAASFLSPLAGHGRPPPRFAAAQLAHPTVDLAVPAVFTASHRFLQRDWLVRVSSLPHWRRQLKIQSLCFRKKNPGTLAMNLPESNRFGTPNPCPTIRASTLQHLFIRLANCQLYKISSVHKQGLTKKNARQTLVFFLSQRLNANHMRIG